MWSTYAVVLVDSPAWIDLLRGHDTTRRGRVRCRQPL
jgi:hypothetical protein